MQERIDHLRQLFSGKVDSLLVSSVPNITYLTNFFGFSEVEREAFLLITPEAAYLLTDARYSEATSAQITYVTTLERTKEKPTTQLLKELTEHHNLKRIGFEDTNLSVAEYTAFKKEGLSLIPFSLRDLRVKKSSAEIQLIRQAASISHTALKKIKRHIHPGVTEIEIALRLELEMKKLGADIAFPTIVAFGKSASVPHHRSDETRLQTNDVVLIDFGATYQGYCSDTTRTFFIGDDIPEKWKVIQHTVRNAQKKAIDFIQRQLDSQKPVLAKEVDASARSYIMQQGFPSIPHSLGHGTGLEVHEAPTLSPTSKDILEEGMVFSIEPGIYSLGEMGVRIEDLFTIQRGKLLRLE